jgi:hypothetical protein
MTQRRWSDVGNEHTPVSSALGSTQHLVKAALSDSACYSRCIRSESQQQIAAPLWEKKWKALYILSHIQEVPGEKKKVKLSLGTPWRHMGSACTEPHFLDLCTSWRWVVNFTPQPLYPRGDSPRYPLDRRLGGHQSRSGQSGEENSNSNPSVVQPVASCCTDWAIPAPTECTVDVL